MDGQSPDTSGRKPVLREVIPIRRDELRSRLSAFPGLSGFQPSLAGRPSFFQLVLNPLLSTGMCETPFYGVNYEAIQTEAE